MTLPLTAGSLFRLPSELPESPRQKQLPESLTCEPSVKLAHTYPDLWYNPPKCFSWVLADEVGQVTDDTRSLNLLTYTENTRRRPHTSSSVLLNIPSWLFRMVR